MNAMNNDQAGSFAGAVKDFENANHSVMVAPPAQGKSLLVHLTEEELAALNAWGASQVGDPARGGAVDMMRWPGWQAVAERRAAGKPALR